ncbi:hypothetical protein HWV00_20945 (plasmid) [Moritella sp. 24]|uniref:hypothetical protein n=1 Tax=Moritella sp. 24 TaxID=2746230 RepID=UPI001BA4ECFF|nr:hypothetical protein [Moritella sp. 24]QUM78742.1 hypothetical protein HWV00_20945 [Moritella sp. 24]
MTREILHREYKNIQQRYAQLQTTSERRAFCRQNAINIGAMKVSELGRLVNGGL